MKSSNKDDLAAILDRANAAQGGKLTGPAKTKPKPVKPTKGEAKSKRSDPDWKPVTLYLTHQTSNGIDEVILAAKRLGKPLGDRSDVAETAIREWLDRQG